MANDSRSRPSNPAGKSGHDSHGNPFERVPGPGPKDAGRGAAGPAAIDQVEGGPERLPDDAQPDGQSNDVEDNDETDAQRRR